MPLAADLAALLSERDLLRGGALRDADIRTRLDILRGADAAAAVDGGARQRARRNARELARQLQRGAAAAGGAARDAVRAAPAVGLLLAFAYPDRIGLRRAGEGGRYTLANGRGALFAEPQSLARPGADRRGGSR